MSVCKYLGWFHLLVMMELLINCLPPLQGGPAGGGGHKAQGSGFLTPSRSCSCLQQTHKHEEQRKEAKDHMDSTRC